MKRITLSPPPDPAQYAANPARWMDAVYRWMVDTRQKVEAASTVNTRPLTPFTVGTYTAVNTLSPAGTDTTGNFVATLVTAMQAEGWTNSRNTP